MGWRRVERKRTIAAAGLATLILSAPALAETQRFYDKSEWEAAVGDYVTLDFTGFEANQILTDEYADLGVIFTDGNDLIRFNPNSFLNDGWGVYSAFDSPIAFALATPTHAVAVDFPGDVFFWLYQDGVFVEEVRFFCGGAGNFGGFISEYAFNYVEIHDLTDGFVFADDIHFAVPAPGAFTMMLAALAGTGAKRRRR